MAELSDPEWVEQIMMTMKEAGVRRFKLDGLEVEFEAHQPDDEAPQVEYVQVPAANILTDTPSSPAPKHGYAALFGGQMPKFPAAKE